MRPMKPLEALERLANVGHDFYAFRNVESGKILYFLYVGYSSLRLFNQGNSRATLMSDVADNHFNQTKGAMPNLIFYEILSRRCDACFHKSVVTFQGRSTSSTSGLMVATELLCPETMSHGSPVMDRHRANSSLSTLELQFSTLS